MAGLPPPDNFPVRPHGFEAAPGDINELTTDRSLRIIPSREWINQDSPQATMTSLVELCTASCREHFDDTCTVAPQYRNVPRIINAIDQMRWFLGVLESKLDASGINQVDFDPKRRVFKLSEFQESLVGLPQNPLYKELGGLWKGFDLAINLTLQQDEYQDPEKRQLFLGSTQRFAQRELYPYLKQSPFCLWASRQYGGYPGDPTIVRMILGDKVTPPTLFGALLDEYHLYAPVAQAHRHRVDDMATWLRGGINGIAATPGQRKRVLNLGCGPAEEVAKLVSQLSSDEIADYFFQLLDINQESLSRAHSNIERSHLGTIEEPHLDVAYGISNAKRLALEAQKGRPLRLLQGEPFDIVYCAGLYDYINDILAPYLLRVLYHQLKPGGTMLITNVNSTNPGRWAMELLINWSLIYRDHEGMKALAENFASEKDPFSAKFRPGITTNQQFLADPNQLKPGEFCITVDPTTFNLFLWIRKNLNGEGPPQ